MSGAGQTVRDNSRRINNQGSGQNVSYNNMPPAFTVPYVSPTEQQPYSYYLPAQAPPQPVGYQQPYYQQQAYPTQFQQSYLPYQPNVTQQYVDNSIYVRQQIPLTHPPATVTAPKKPKSTLTFFDPKTKEAVVLSSDEKKLTPEVADSHTSVNKDVKKQFSDSVKERIEESNRSKANSISEDAKPVPEMTPTAVHEEKKPERVARISETEKPNIVQQPIVEKPVLEQVVPVVEQKIIEELEEASVPQTPTPEPACLDAQKEVSVSPDIPEESKPSPIPPSADSPESPEDEEVDEETRAKEEEERKRAREAELDDKIALLNDSDEVDENIGFYGREFLVTLRNLEKEFKRTPCPLTPDELNGFGLDINHMPKKPFATSWQQPSKPMRPNNGNQYKGRVTTDGSGRGGHRYDKGNNKKPPTNRGSIERMPKSSLPTSRNAWKPPSKMRESDDVSEEEKKIRETCKNVRSLMNKITPTTAEALTNEFHSYRVYDNMDQLKRIVEIIFDKAVEEPKFCDLYSQLCKDVVNYEMKDSDQVPAKSHFRDGLLFMAQQCFNERTLEEEVKAKRDGTNIEDPVKRAEFEANLHLELSKLRRRKFGNMTFIGHLFRHQLLSAKIIGACVKDLFVTCLKKNEKKETIELDEESMQSKNDKKEATELDEESIQCGIQLLETCGHLCEKHFGSSFMNQWLSTLKEIMPHVSNKIRFMIMNLSELRDNNWVPRKSVDIGPKKITEIHKDAEKEKMENERAREQYERKQGGYRSGGNSLRKVPPPSRNSYDRRKQQGDPSKAFAAATSVKNPTMNRKPMPMSQMEDERLGGKSKRWSVGAAGGGGGNDAAQQQQQMKPAWGNKGGDFSSVIEAARNVGSGNLESRRSASQTSIAESEPIEKVDRIGELSKLEKRITSDIQEILEEFVTIDEVASDFRGYIGSTNMGSPTVEELYATAIRAPTTQGKKLCRKTLGNILCKMVGSKEESEKFITGVTNFCKDVVADDAFIEDNPNVWLNTAEVLFHTMYAPQAIETSYRLSLADLAQPILESMNDSRKNKRYELLVTLLKKLAEHELEGNLNLKEAVATAIELSSSGLLEKLNKEELMTHLENCKVSTGASVASLLHL